MWSPVSKDSKLSYVGYSHIHYCSDCQQLAIVYLLALAFTQTLLSSLWWHLKHMRSPFLESAPLHTLTAVVLLCKDIQSVMSLVHSSPSPTSVVAAKMTTPTFYIYSVKQCFTSVSDSVTTGPCWVHQWPQVLIGCCTLVLIGYCMLLPHRQCKESNSPETAPVDTYWPLWHFSCIL